MSYELIFDDEALNEFRNLPEDIRGKFKKKLEERLLNPRIPKHRLRGDKDLYKIKLLADGYRLVYRVNDKKIEIVVIVVGKRDKNLVYKTLEKRLKK